MTEKCIVDLRSDTVTKPTGNMLERMLAAKVGDDVYREDPSINELEQKVAEILGKESALFVPSGTMANQIAIHLHCRPGDSVIAEQHSHCFEYEAGAAAALSGVQFDFFSYQDDDLSDSIKHLIRSPQVYAATSRLLVLENTHNRGGGRTLSPKDIQSATMTAKEYGLATHCDGARLWNAAVAQKVDIKQLSQPFDSIAVCLSKGLGCPAGSLLAASEEVIDRARKIRKRWGGGMRQAGFLAAAGTYALDHHRHRLADDHRRSQRLLDGIKNLKWNGLACETIAPNPITNMIYFRWDAEQGDALSEALRKRGILVSHLGQGWLRAVTHLDVNDQDIEQTLHALQSIVPSN